MGLGLGFSPYLVRWFGLVVISLFVFWWFWWGMDLGRRREVLIHHARSIGSWICVFHYFTLTRTVPPSIRAGHGLRYHFRWSNGMQTWLLVFLSCRKTLIPKPFLFPKLHVCIASCVVLYSIGFLLFRIASRYGIRKNDDHSSFPFELYGGKVTSKERTLISFIPLFWLCWFRDESFMRDLGLAFFVSDFYWKGVDDREGRWWDGEYSENGTANEKTKGVLQIWERESVGDSERKRSSPGHLDTYTHIHTSISSLY